MKFKGELHKVKLINFSVDIEEVIHQVPQGLKIFQENGKAIISMVDVQLKHMKTKWFPFVNFGYRHVAFRLLLDDREYSQQHEPQGIYFLKSFSENAPLNWMGNLIGNYQLTFAKLKEYFGAFNLQQKKNYVEYALDPYSVIDTEEGLQRKIKRIDRAYASKNGSVFVTKIAREHWPIQPIKCYHFATNFFKSAKLLGAFEVKNVIHYTWNDATKIEAHGA